MTRGMRRAPVTIVPCLGRSEHQSGEQVVLACS
jgi:hypothetical protein